MIALQVVWPRRQGLRTRRIVAANIRSNFCVTSRRTPGWRLRRFNDLYKDGRIQEIACWAHVRRKFYDLAQTAGSPIAKEALERIGVLYAIEKRDSPA